MPKPKNKKASFIDKKNSISFHLVHRSQQDPLAADDTAPQMVLKSILPKELESKAKEEERKYGLFFEDEYNYMQHLKDRNLVEHDWSEADRFIVNAESRKLAPETKSKLVLPSTVFATEGQEEDVGLLNKAAKSTGLDLSLDPDIVAAMDEDFDFEDPDNALEDDFIMKAMMGPGEDEGEYDDSDDDDGAGSDMDSDFGGGRSEDEDDDDVPSLKSWTGEETGTKFTNYSMSSSCIRRNDQLSLLDDKFDRFMDQYGEMEEGALEGEDIEGVVEESGDRMKQLLLEAERTRKTERQQLEREKEVVRNLLMREERDELEEILMPVDADGRREQWDCESVLSTYSTLYNHPKLISEPRSDRILISSKTGLPKDTLGRGLTSAALKQLDRETGQLEDDVASVRSRVTELSIRPKHETLEEKKSRKAAVKEIRKERREEKKANSEAFKTEKIRQEKININVKNNIQGIKIY